MTRRLAIGLSMGLFLGLSLGGCGKKADTEAKAPAAKAEGAQVQPAAPEPGTVSEQTPAAQPAPAVTPAPEAPKTAEAPVAAEPTAVQPAEAPAAHAHGHAGEDCAHASSTRIDHPTEEVRTDAEGRSYTHVGAELASAEVVKVSELLSAPAKYAGKTVRVEGDINGMCHHKRRWLSVAAEDQSGRSLRVISAPAFLVPSGSIGKHAVAEGKVEVVEVSANMARHLAAEHKLAEPESVQGPQQEPVLRATGADIR